jgi:NAD(P)-dependent dehydrogenase (short-subunit alcohol dehydrogenase family)
MQNLASALTENGADVALMTDDIKSASRFSQNLMDLREVSEKYGRAAAIESKFDDEKSAQDDFSRSAELFGTTDIYIDTHLYNINIPFMQKETLEDMDHAFAESFKKSHMMTGAALSFILGRSKSRVLYVVNQLDLLTLQAAGSKKPAEFSDYVLNLCRETQKENVTVNALAVGVSEEYILTHIKAPSIQAGFREMQKQIPMVRLVEYVEVASMVSFLVSSHSTALNGQVIQLNHGMT